MRNLFFDRERIRNTVDARTRKVLSKFGAYVRQTSRRSIRKRKGTSKPGDAPSSHVGTLKNMIYFAYEPDSHSVVIGPVVASGKSGKAPSALEHGGKLAVSSQIEERAALALPLGPETRSRRSLASTVEIEPRPYMGPAFEKELQNLPAIWQGVIK